MNVYNLSEMKFKLALTKYTDTCDILDQLSSFNKNILALLKSLFKMTVI